MEQENTPQVGQRFHADGIGFGTIREIKEVEQEGLRTKVTTRLKVRFDAGKTCWKNLSEVELIKPDVRYTDDPTYGQFSL